MILLLYIKYFCRKNLEVKEEFVTLFDLESKHAVTIAKKLKEWLIQQEIFDKIKFYCSDAAHNVASEGGGVPGLLMQDLKLLKSHKCLCHLQNTALKHTYKNFPLIQSFNKKLVDLVNYIDGSSVRVRIMEDQQIQNDFDNVYQLIKAKEIRWNTFFYCTNRVRKLYAAIHDAAGAFIKVASTKNEEKEAIEMKNKYILDFNFVYLLHWLSDFLQPICVLNKALQETNYQLAKLKDDIDTTLQVLKADYI
jgi:hypothetical protein